MIKQNEPLLLEPIKKYGCLYLDLVRIIELETGYDFQTQEVNEVWIKSLRERYIVNNLMKNPDGLLKNLAKLTDRPYLTIAQVGIIKDAKIVFWEWARKAYTNYKYMIEKVKTFGEVGTHFRLADNRTNVIYDSYDYKDYEYVKIKEWSLYGKIQ